jgi:hypothetical protein
MNDEKSTRFYLIKRGEMQGEYTIYKIITYFCAKFIAEAKLLTMLRAMLIFS